MPLFLTQGLTENNTVADGTAQYLDNHAGYERAWLGPWEHVRGNERDENGRLKMGRAGFFDEVMRFYDQFLKGTAPAVQDPPIAVQTNDGKWRAEQSWPPADATRYTSQLRTGSYTDDGSGSATETTDTEGVWTISPRLTNAAHLAGSGRAIVDVATTRPNANLVVDVYDLDEYGIGPLVTRQGFLARSERREDARPMVGRLEDPGRPPDRRASDRRQRGLVDPHAAVRHGRGGGRLGDAAVPHLRSGPTRSRATRARSSRAT